MVTAAAVAASSGVAPAAAAAARAGKTSIKCSLRSTTPRRAYHATPQRCVAASSSSSSSSSSRDPLDRPQKDSDLSFGGGSSSRGGPPSRDGQAYTGSSSSSGGGSSSQSGGSTSSTSSSASSPRRNPLNGTPPPTSILISGSAGKGAVPGYGKRRRAGGLPDQSRTATRERDDEIVRGYEHTYAPTMRSPRAMPHHTYFSSPSTSFNSAASVSPSGSSFGESRVTTALRPKKTALIFPGQGSQYVAMCRDIYRSFRSARSVWHTAEEALVSPLLPSSSPFGSGHPSTIDDGERGNARHSSLGYIPGRGQERAQSEQQRRTFEEELAKSHKWDERRSANPRGRRGWLRDTVFFGDQLDLTRAENAQPSILVATLSILAVLRKEFSLDVVSSQVTHASGHGSGIYAALVGSGALDMIDAVRLLRHRGLLSSQHVANHPILFPPGCTRPESVYETWAFANAGSGKGAELLSEMQETGGVPPTSAATDGDVVRQEVGNQDKKGWLRTVRGWKRTQMSGVMVRPGLLPQVLEEVQKVQAAIHSGSIPNVAQDEVVEVANINSSLQVVLSGTRVGVSLACDTLRNANLGARAVNLPVSGPYHSSIMQGAVLGPALANLPLRAPDEGMTLVSSVDGSVLRTADEVRQDLTGALAKPVRWLDSVERLRSLGVERFICLGPGRSCAHLLSRELGYQERMEKARERAAAEGAQESTVSGGNNASLASRTASGEKPEYEVWSVATVEDIETLSSMLSNISDRSGQEEVASAMEADRRRGGVDRGMLAV